MEFKELGLSVSRSLQRYGVDAWICVLLDISTVSVEFPCMKTVLIGDFQNRFLEILDEVKSGEKITITSGDSGEGIAVLTPCPPKRGNGVKFGLLEGELYKIHDNFEMTAEELISL